VASIRLVTSVARILLFRYKCFAQHLSTFSSLWTPSAMTFHRRTGRATPPATIAPLGASVYCRR